ncbi:hypothetical protein DSO57_1006046 [Entomophthora muscae]|uniref:Uncharacterized protein n=1 Tax=Entomophthora muscae TaxID=34485 RepID=A0ACC2U763_9FUNG|nr:hypothetical protein DSO57_1006046 [Entomophthora muscae]
MFDYLVFCSSLNYNYSNVIFNECKKFGIDVEGLHTKTGPGMFKAALLYKPAMQMADNVVLFKTSVKQIGLRHGVMASFMAKPI